MAKYLRFISTAHSDISVNQAIAEANAIHITPMYEFYATPIQSNGIAKLNIELRATGSSTDPVTRLDIANIATQFDLLNFSKLESEERKKFVLERIHETTLRAAKYYNWPTTTLQLAYHRILREKFQFIFCHGKPKSSPNRRLKVKASCDFNNEVRVFLIFQNKAGDEINRVLISIVGPGMGIIDFILGNIRWLDNETVQVTHKNDRDYWFCSVNGDLQFYYPRVDNGDAHAEYDLADMYLHGKYVLANRELGMKLLQSSAEKGYKHAIKLLGQKGC